jgi:hypothetical protein
LYSCFLLVLLFSGCVVVLASSAPDTLPTLGGRKREGERNRRQRGQRSKMMNTGNETWEPKEKK